MEKWQKLLSKAVEYKYESEGLLDSAVQELMRTKGFSEEQVALFDACFAGGNETIVRFNRNFPRNPPSFRWGMNWKLLFSFVNIVQSK